jgi:DNA-binding transcriptional regulator LsrR (DeoR family)
MSRIDELRLMTRVARLYHESGVKQPEIASRLRLSQPKVSRLLRQAQEEGIVRITVRAPTGTYPDLELALIQRYGLQDAEVVDVSTDDTDRITRELGEAAAYHLEQTVRSGDVIGVSSWSATLLAMVDAMHPVRGLTDVRVVQILGGGGDPAAEGHATHLVRRLADLLGAEATFLPAPSSVRSAAARRVLLDEPFVRRATALFDQLTVALVGIGGLEPSGLLASSGNVFSADELATVRASGGVGDIGLRYLRGDGRPVETPLDDRVIGIELEQLHRAPRAIGVAGGPSKVLAIRAALLGGWTNCLVTDRSTADRLLEPAADPGLLEEPMGAGVR